MDFILQVQGLILNRTDALCKLATKDPDKYLYQAVRIFNEKISIISEKLRQQPDNSDYFKTKMVKYTCIKKQLLDNRKKQRACAIQDAEYSVYVNSESRDISRKKSTESLINLKGSSEPLNKQISATDKNNGEVSSCYQCHKCKARQSSLSAEKHHLFQSELM